METVNSGKSQSISVVTGDTTATHEVSEEFVLPDYIPEIRKLLLCRASVLPEGKFISDSTVDISGSVTYLVIYTDDEGKLCSTPLSSSYEASVAMPNVSSSVFVDTTVEAVTPRVSAPRRLSIKSRLKSRAISTQGKEIKENITPCSAADEMYLERQKKTLDAFEIATCSLGNIRMSDKFDMQGISKAEPLWCDATLAIYEYKAQNRSISVRADVTVKCICRGENDIFTLTKTLPLAEELECEECKTGSMVRVQGRCVSLSISNELNGDTSQLFFDICCELEAEAVVKKEAELTVDCYSTKYESTSSYKDIEAYSVAKMSSCGFTFSEAVKRKAADSAQILDQMATPVCEKAEIKGKKLILGGKLLLDTVEQGSTEQTEYFSNSYELPFKYESELAEQVGDCVIRASFDIGNLSLRADSEKLYITAELYPSFTVLEKTRARVLDSAVLDKDSEIKNDASCVRVYFPKGSDTLWEVAKKYHTTVNKITQDNELQGTELGKHIIV